MAKRTILQRFRAARHAAVNAYTGRFTTLDADGFPVFNTKTATGLSVSADRALYATAVFACVNLLSTVIASIPLKLKRTLEDNDTEDALDDSLYRLLSIKPNPFQTAYSYQQQNLEHILLRGGFVSWVNRVNGRPVALIPLHPDTIQRELTDDGLILFSGIAQWGPNKYLRFDKVPQTEFYWTNYRTLDGLNPCSPIKYAAESIGLALAAEEHGARLFQNDATPPIVISHPEKLSPEHLLNLAKMWKKGGSGDNYGMPRFIDGGAKLERIQMSNEDAQYFETRRFQREDICGIFRVPPSMIGDTQRAQGWSTLEQKNSDFLTYTLSPYLTNIEQAITFSLISESAWGRVYPQFETQYLMKSDTATRTAYYRDLYNLGAFSPNEIRHREGLNSREGGNEYVRAGSMVIDSDLDSKGKPQAPPTPAPQPNQDGDEDVNL